MDVAKLDTLTGATADDRRRLLKWYAGMSDAQRVVVAAHQTTLMRRRRHLRAEAGQDVFAYAMFVAALYQLRHAKESLGRRRQQPPEQLALLERLRQAGQGCRRPKKRGPGEKAEAFIRAHYDWLPSAMERESLDRVLDFIRREYRLRFSRSTFYQAFQRIQKNMADWEAACDDTKAEKVPDFVGS
ncbi:hypothetical protein [Desulfurivibrio alkaliphilus]|uniref:Uncharacterized protein n=1 Tax=Desulfurivibrio alkaliphilus (strain DSM 19089 / UNIQEM U267 / AHT2) TaxID=589865 RepID=D6Z683_DESAT|nr:hypothetical protein [Desulfurivibrio alkaliphilus]ADH86848.1 hypothetical protein DaAHT2_2180 [Desulfurivibrio alkaliphilus AHT 2]